MRVLLTGQSNAYGNDYGGPSLETVSSKVKLWNNTNPLGANGTAWQECRVAAPVVFIPPSGGLQGGNMGPWFAHNAAIDLYEDVFLTVVGKGGEAIEHWILSDNGVAEMLAECIAVRTAQGNPAPADILMWHQGESNVLDNYATYSAKFLEVVSLLKSNNIITATAKILIGGLAETDADRIAFNTNVLQPLVTANVVDNYYYVSSVGIPSRPGDSVHFSADGLAAFGKRYWDTIKLQYISLEDVKYNPANHYLYTNNERTPIRITPWRRWTPRLSFGGNSAGIVYGYTPGGFYRYIGDMMHVNGVIAITNKGSATGAAMIEDMPAQAYVHDNLQVGIPGNFNALTGILYATATGYSNALQIRQSTTSGDAAVNNTHFKNGVGGALGTFFYFNGKFMVNN